MAARPLHEQTTLEATAEEVRQQITAGIRAFQRYLDDQVAQGHTTAERAAALMEQARGHAAKILRLTTLTTAAPTDPSGSPDGL
ncbi:hypothetical protein AB0395_33955 [Streptosporangium sp. NPDC051023]|uniref:hypothetical protein n=1 Tax=Streptosporangium sp. NPDC051023 TaxID=3155410 RepID=UPI00344F0685